MKAGFVARIRVNPKDCLSILDVVQSSGLNIEGMSFSSITSLAMSCMLESLRKQKVIPINDGFDYERRMRAYVGGKSSYDRRVLTEAIYVGSAAGLPLPDLSQTPPIDPHMRQALWKEYEGLNDSFSTHSPEQRDRYKELEKVFTT